MKQSIDVVLDQYIDQVLLEIGTPGQAVIKKAPAKTTYQLTDQKIAKKIYDSKGYISDDEESTIDAITSIKTQAQYKNVDSALKSMTSGQSMAGYINTFTKISDRLIMAVHLDRIGISIETCKKYITQDEFLMMSDRSGAVRVDGNEGLWSLAYLGRLGKNNIEKAVTHIIMDPRWGYKSQYDRVSMGTGPSWFTTHNTWDTFINGAGYEKDGMRDAAYSPAGIVVSAVASVIPYVNILPRAMFGILLVDDVYRLANGTERLDTIWLDIIFDLLGVFVGNGAAGAAFKGLGALLGKLTGPAFTVTKTFIQACIRICGPGIQTLLNSLLKFLGSGLSAITKSITELLKKWAKNHPESSAIIKLVGQKIQGFTESVNNLLVRPIAILKFIIQTGITKAKWATAGGLRWLKIIQLVVWHVMSAPGREVYRDILRFTNIEWMANAFKLAFNTTVVIKSVDFINQWDSNSAAAEEKKKHYDALDDIVKQH